MNLSVDWIDELVGLPEELRDPRALAERLTMIAAAVEKIEPVGAGLDGIVVARVLEVGPHPNADRLSLCKVDRGDAEPLDVVCGAPVIVEGALYPHVAPGHALPSGFEIEARKIRGELSHGMLCSEVELELGRDKGGIMRLADDLRPGASLSDALGLPDTRLTLDLNPNRVDLACHLGVARELVPALSAIRERDFGTTWNATWRDGDAETAGAGVRVRIEASDRCSRYMGAVIRGVKIGPSPAWLAGRLLAAGARPINNVVDATNFVMLERNQPLHAFDLATIAGSEVRIRAATDGETLTTLDGEERKLTRGSTVIADPDRAIALAGVMGGAATEVTEATTDLLIECGAFRPMGVRATARDAGLATDASYRFERGIDLHAQEAALARCVELILATAGGEAEPEALRVGPSPASPIDLSLRVGRVGRVLGLSLDARGVGDLLSPIGLAPRVDEEAGVVSVTVPGWRSDLTREIDVVEEVARRVGFEEFPAEDRRFRPSSVPEDPRVSKAARVRRELVARGLNEVRSLSFMPGEHRGNRAIVAVPNPLSAEESYLRAGMVPVLLRRVEHNFARGHRDVRLFEIGTVFDYGEGSGIERFAEARRVGVVLTGGRTPAHWSGLADDLDAWDLKAIVERVARLVGGRTIPAPAGDDENALGSAGWLGTGAFAIETDDGLVGLAGPVRDAALDMPPWAAPAFALEFDLDAVRPRDHATYRETSPFPAVRRDLSVTVPARVRAGDVEVAVRGAASDLLENVRLFDVYAGEELGEGRRALGWAFRFRAPDRTLTDDEVESEMGAVSGALEEQFDAEIRSS